MTRAKAWLLAALLGLPSCRTVGFYTQAVGGQTEVILKRKPVERVLATTPDDALHKQLELTRRLLAFAEAQLLMPSEGTFSSYADLERKHLVWVIHAAPEFSMEPKQWWYPVVGCQEYRGYFSEAKAEAEAHRLERAGTETWISKVDAYSTLGYFRDPLLNTYIHRPETDLAELIFHELSHQKYYRPGDTRFNEAMAEAVAREGVRRWFRHTGRPDMVARYEQRLGRAARARAAISRCAGNLEALYAKPLADPEKRRRKPYEPPRVTSEDVFETMALSCTKMGPLECNPSVARS